ncbi:chemotaxis protein [Rhizobium sp. 9T]|nr:chemotaxis protein [Rhizobium croatiense]
MVETVNSSGPNTTHQGRDPRDPERAVDLEDQKARFCADIAAFADAAMNGDLTRRMNADYTDPDFGRSATMLNELMSLIDNNLADFNDAMAALAQGDLHRGMRDKHRGAFGPLQKNFNLAMATLRTVLGEQGAERFTNKASKFRRMLTAVGPDETELRPSGDDSRPVQSPPHDLWLRLAEALNGFRR